MQAQLSTQTNKSGIESDEEEQGDDDELDDEELAAGDEEPLLPRHTRAARGEGGRKRGREGEEVEKAHPKCPRDCRCTKPAKHKGNCKL